MKEGGTGGGEKNAAFVAVEEKPQCRAVEVQIFEDKGHIREGRNGMSIVDKRHGVRGLVGNIASTRAVGECGVERSKEAVK
jgi:hypothetical protein